MIEGGDQVGDVLAYIRLDEPRLVRQLRPAIGQVGSDNAGQQALVIGLAEGLDAGGEEREGSQRIDAVGLAGLELLAQIEASISSATRMSLPSTSAPRYSCATMGLRPLITVV